MHLWRQNALDADSRRRLLTDQALHCCLAALTMLVLFGLKVYIACRDLNHDFPPPRIWDGALLPSLGRVLGCSTEDFAVGLACLLAGLMLIRLNRRTWFRW